MSSDPRHLSIIVEDKQSASKSAPPPESPVSPVPESPVRLKGHGRGRSASRVSMDHFDPEGVQALERQMTRESARLREQSTGPRPKQKTTRGSGSSSTLAGDEEDFDFQRAVRHTMRR